MEIVNRKVIIAILPKGKAAIVVKSLVKEYNMNSVDVHYARGVGRLTPLSHRGIGETSEKEVLSLSTNIEMADEIFEHIYHKAEINQPHGGLMFMHDLAMSTKYILPELPEEKWEE